MTKFRNTRVELDGHRFPSKLEASTYGILKARGRTGEIKSIKVQDQLYLGGARIGYRADFRCEGMNGEIWWVEAKGMDGQRWRIIKKLWAFDGPGKLEIYKGSHLKPYLDETIWPRTHVAIPMSIAEKYR